MQTPRGRELQSSRYATLAPAARTPFAPPPVLAAHARPLAGSPIAPMPDSDIFSEPYGRVFLDEAVPCVIIQWLGFANRTEFMALQDTALRYIEAHATLLRPCGLVADVRHRAQLPAGTYLLRLQAGAHSETRRVVMD